MGVLPKFCTPGLVWVFGLLFCALLLQANTQVSADSKEDSDLVFDSLDSTNLRNRIARGSSSYSHSESSHPVEEHWLSRTVNRIKRSIGSIFSKDEQQTNSHHKVPQEHREKILPERQNINDHHVKLNRKHRQSDYDDPEEEDDYDEGQEEDMYDTLNGQVQVEDYDEEDDYNVVNGFNESNGYGDIQIGEGDSPLEHETDDEDDDDGLGSGKDGSGEVDTETPPTTTTIKPIGPPKYYRFTFSAQEYYAEDFNDRNSNLFQDLERRVKRSVEELFTRSPGDQTATVISIEKVESDDYFVRVTFDLTSVGWDDEESIRRVIYDELVQMHRLGGLTASPENFAFRAFEDSPCNETQIICNSNQCVDQNTRCNGVRDCNDNSDEVGCPPPTTTRPTPPPTPIPTAPVPTPPEEEEITNPPTTHPPTTLPPTTLPPTTHRPTTQRPVDIVVISTTTTTTPFSDFGSGEGRSDDELKCDDGHGTYYGDQKCDGIPDCSDGSDEKDCNRDESKCALGEYSCDVTRCIPESSRCDGLSDCSDKTDERECFTCKANAFHCDNSCIHRDRVCDRNQDCEDGADERGCQGKSES